MKKQNSDKIGAVSPEVQEHAWYLQRFATGPSLTQEQQRHLLSRAKAGDTDAEDLLVRAYLPLVASLATRYLDRGLPLADLLQEGAIGLVHAIRIYDPTVYNTPLRTFAHRGIRWAMHMATRTSKQWLKIPSAIREQIDSVNSATFQLFQEYGVAVVDEAAARKAGLSDEDVALLDIVTEPPLSLDTELTLEITEEDTWVEPGVVRDQLFESCSLEEEILQREQRETLLSALQELPAKERFVLLARFGLQGREAGTLEEVGRLLGVTRERIRQREHKALRLLRSGGGHVAARYRPAIHALHLLHMAERGRV